MKRKTIRKRLARLLMHASSIGLIQNSATRLATMFVTEQYAQVALARINHRGFLSPSANLRHCGLIMGKHCFIGSDVLILNDRNGGNVVLGDEVHIHRGTVIQTGHDGTIRIDNNTHIQPDCLLSGYKGSIRIGSGVEIAPSCAFYPYNHGIKAGSPIRQQAIVTKGGIVVGDDAWLGHGVIVLDGAHIGKGAVIGAGSVVTGDVPDGAIAFGTPARVTGYRD